jgi:DNA replication protein DnaC
LARLNASSVRRHITDAVADAIISDTLDTTPILAATKRWWRTTPPKPTIMLCGTVGRSKTVASAWVLSEASTGGVFITAHRMLRVFAGRYGRDTLTEQDRLLSTKVLVIDDVGRELDDSREAMQSALLEIVDGRQSSVTLTIITTNLSTANFKRRYPSSRLFSRLHQQATIVEDTGDDLRRK